MSQQTEATQPTLFGMPIGGFGFFTSLLFGGVMGALAFFVGTFLGIVGLMIYNTAMHAQVDYSLAYKRLGLTLGLVSAVVAWSYLGRLWVARVSSSKH